MIIFVLSAILPWQALAGGETRPRHIDLLIMLEDIQKILKQIKRGVVIVENGKPAYVLVPFDDYEKSLPAGRGADSYDDSPKQREMDDPSLIQKMIDYEVEMNSREVSTLEEMNAMLDKSGASDNQAKEINLEDLPF